MISRTFAALAVTLVALASTRSAHAEKKPPAAAAKVAGTFDTSFEKVSDNCKEGGMTLDKGTVSIREPKKSRVEVEVSSVPKMAGTVSRGGKFKAEVKRAKTAVADIEGRFSIAGKVDGGKLDFVLIAEYYKGGKPLCTQSWNATPAKP